MALAPPAAAFGWGGAQNASPRRRPPLEPRPPPTATAQRPATLAPRRPSRRGDRRGDACAAPRASSCAARAAHAGAAAEYQKQTTERLENDRNLNDIVTANNELDNLFYDHAVARFDLELAAPPEQQKPAGGGARRKRRRLR